MQGIQLVDGSVRGVVCTTETSFSNIATLIPYGVTAGVHDPSQFYVLVIIGLAGVSSTTPILRRLRIAPSTLEPT
jgi:hypothetical protein